MSRFVHEIHPTLVLNVNRGLSSGQLREILLGIEEEGVPITLNEVDELNPLKLAHDASVESVLGVGLGISLDYVVLTTEQLPQDRPYLAHYLNTSEANDRIIGGNAARLVKRIPLKPLETEQQGES